MNDLYGVDPAAPIGGGELISLVRLFGPTEGRFIAAFPDNWRDKVVAMLAARPPLERARAMEWMNRRKHAFLDTSRRYQPEAPWAENAEKLREDVRALIGPRGCLPTFLSIDTALFEFQALPDARGDLIPRTSAAYVRAAWPLLTISPKVVLIDPYLRLRGSDERSRAQAVRQRRVIEELLAEANRRRKVSVFRLCISAKSALEGDPDASAFEQDLAQVQAHSGATDLSVEYEVLEDGRGPRQHARYLLGAGCGLQFDHGFDTASNRSTNHVHWLSLAELGSLLVRHDLPGP